MIYTYVSGAASEPGPGHDDADKHSSNGVKFNSIELNCCWHNASKANATIRYNLLPLSLSPFFLPLLKIMK